MPFDHLEPLSLVLLAMAALIVGVSKTAIPGATTIAVAIFAAILPAREATAALLILLIVGDVMAIASYRRHANWSLLIRLMPIVLAGVALGALFLAFVNDEVARRVVGAILLALVAMSWWIRHRAVRASDATRARGVARAQAIAYGTLGGFTTMVANAGGPVMSMYFLALRFDVKTFLGTSAWFFAIVNLIKVPVVAGLGLLDASTLSLAAVLVPAVLIGALSGRWIAPRLSQKIFARVVLVLTIVGALYLLLR